MSALDFLATNLQVGNPAQYKPAKFGEVVQSALYDFGQRTGYEITPVLETAQDYSDRDSLLKQRFTADELQRITGNDEELRGEALKIDAAKGLPFYQGYTPDITEVKNQRLDNAILAGRNQDAVRWQGIKTSEELREEKRNRARAARESFEDISSRATPTAAIAGSLVGGLGAAFTDPINIATLPFGATSGMGILKAMKTEALLNAAVEAAEVPLVASWQKELGHKYGVGNAVFDVATAGAGGAALTGIVRGARPAAEFLKDKFDLAGKYVGSKSQPILQKMSDSEKLPSSVREAAKYMSRVAHIDENNPMLGRAADEEIGTKAQAQDTISHRQTLQDTQDSFKNYQEPIYNNPNLGRIESEIEKAGFDKQTAKLYSRAIEAFYNTQSIRGNVETQKVLDSYLKGLEIRNAKFGGESKSGDDSDLFLDNFINMARKPQKNNKSGKPLQKFLKEKGGVKVGSNLAGELKAMGINPKTAPGLFKKNGKIGDVDNIPASEFIDRFKLPDALTKGDYIDRQYILDLLDQETRGQDISNKRIRLNASQKDLIFRPNDALASIQRDVETIESLNTADTFKADFERFFKDNPDLEIETDAGRLTLKEIRNQIEEDETILSSIRTCAIGKK